MRKKKITKGELKEDGFILLARKIADFTNQNRRRVVSWGVITIEVLIVIFITAIILGQWERASEEEFISTQGIYDQDSFQEAKEGFEKILKSYPISSSRKLALFYKGNCHYHLGEYDKALADFERFAKRNPGHFLTPFAREAIANTYEQKKDYLKAIEVYKTLIKAAPKVSNVGYAWLSIGRCYKKLENYKEAQEAYQKVIIDFPQSSWVEEAQFASERLKELQGSDKVTNKDQ
ncbi:TPA: hypothetical protein DCX15_03300 [bacterium]|nr:hypothetical protein [bacterium]